MLRSKISSPPPPVDICRGVRQGSVLSPLLFIVLMDELANRLQSGKVGTTLEGIFVGGGLHADDIRTVSNDKRGVVQQAEIVDDFVKSRGLNINPSKTEIVAFSKNNLNFVNENIVINGTEIPLSSQGCCLGYWWHRSLLSTNAVDENIVKARKAFFASGCLGTFQGQLNPLSSRSIYITCIVPVLLYGCENWILNESLLNHLECFQAWAGKRLLGLTKHHNNTIVPIALNLPCVRSMILVKKLRFLVKLMSNTSSTDRHLSRDVFAALAMKDILNIFIVSQCLYLEDNFGTDCTTRCLERPAEANTILSSYVDVIYDQSKSIFIQKAMNTHNLRRFMEIENQCSWMKSWDWALDYGVKGTKACQLSLKVLTARTFGRTCEVCNGDMGDSTFLEHALSSSCSRFSIVPFTVAELCDAIGTENLFTYTKILFLNF